MTHVWNSKMGGAASMQVELLESIIPHDRRELALALFHENDYSINGKILLFGRRRILLIEYDTIPPPKFFPDPILSHPRSNFPTNITSHHHHPGILEKVMIPPRRLDWPQETKKAFAKSITREKDFVGVSKRTKMTSGDCQAYYYSTFKGTREYSSMLKRHHLKKRNVRTRSSNVGVSSA
jgi:hypothetical protein